MSNQRSTETIKKYSTDVPLRDCAILFYSVHDI